MNWTGGQRSSSLSQKVPHTNCLKQCVKRLKLMRLEMEIRQNGATMATTNIPDANNRKHSRKAKTATERVPKKRTKHARHGNKGKGMQDFALKTSIANYKSTRKLAMNSQQHQHAQQLGQYSGRGRGEINPV